MKTKYVVLKGHIIDEIYVFGDIVQHSDFASGFFQDVISAGFVSENFECYGESFSLKVKSRGDIDTKLLRQMLRLKE